MNRRWVVAAAALTAAVAAPSGAVTQSEVAPCERMAAVSAGAASAPVVFCAGDIRDAQTGEVTGIAVHSSSDSGKTWTRRAATPLGASAGRIVNLWAVGTGGLGRSVFVQTSLLGLLRSVDDGDTFLPADPQASGRVTGFSGVPAASLTPTGEVGPPRPLFAEAIPGREEGVNASALFDPGTLGRAPVRGSPGFDRMFVFSPGYQEDHQAFVVASRGVGATMRYGIYACDVVLTCDEPLAEGPARWSFDRLWLAGDYGRSHTMFVHLTDPTLRGHLLRSTDGGKRFATWDAERKLQWAPTEWPHYHSRSPLCQAPRSCTCASAEAPTGPYRMSSCSLAVTTAAAGGKRALAGSPYRVDREGQWFRTSPTSGRAMGRFQTARSRSSPAADCLL